MKMIIAATFALGVSVAIADKLSDFEEAAAVVDAKPVGKAGCKSIPYSDYRSTCESEGAKSTNGAMARRGR